MPDHEHADLVLYHERNDELTLAEHLEEAHGWARDNCTLGDLLRVHRRRHDGEEGQAMTVQREATREWAVTEADGSGGWRVREIMAVELSVEGGALVAVEPLTGEIAMIWGPGAWRTASRSFVTVGQYADGDPGNYPHGRLVAVDGGMAG